MEHTFLVLTSCYHFLLLCSRLATLGSTMSLDQSTGPSRASASSRAIAPPSFARAGSSPGVVDVVTLLRQRTSNTFCRTNPLLVIDAIAEAAIIVASVAREDASRFLSLPALAQCIDDRRDIGEATNVTDATKLVETFPGDRECGDRSRAWYNAVRPDLSIFVFLIQHEQQLFSNHPGVFVVGVLYSVGRFVRDRPNCRVRLRLPGVRPIDEDTDHHRSRW